MGGFKWIRIFPLIFKQKANLNPIKDMVDIP